MTSDIRICRVERTPAPPVEGRQAEAVVDMGTCTEETPRMGSGEHNAAASAAGYLYQVRWALLNLLREGKIRPDQVISLEVLDDVAWEDAAGGGD